MDAIIQMGKGLLSTGPSASMVILAGLVGLAVVVVYLALQNATYKAR